ncbi:MAG: hypothetical protein PHG66_01770 [Candidatus Colwellbacteria bacterium]|nr:hypothetical protein [Candidatus Colwellbacteria bacterium]
MANVEQTKKIDMDVENEEDFKQRYLDLKRIYDSEKKVFESSVIVDTGTEIYAPSIFTKKPTVPAQSPPKTITMLRWNYEDDDGSWAPATQSWNDIVTAKYNVNDKNVQKFTVTVGKFNYDISICDDKGYQVNTQTNKKRMIECERREKTETPTLPVIAISPTYNVGIPGIVYDETILKAFKMSGGPPSVIPISQGTDEYMEIEGRFLYIGYNKNPSMISRGARITGIDRILSPNVAKKYLLSKSLLSNKNERLLFHGCKEPSVFQSIFNEGLDFRESSVGLLGQGIYMGDSPFYPHNGGFTGYPDKNGVRTMFVVACLVGSEHDAGDVYHSDSTTRYAFQAKKKPGSKFNSIRAQTTDENCGIYCVYDNSQCYVTHAVSYIL